MHSNANEHVRSKTSTNAFCVSFFLWSALCSPVTYNSALRIVEKERLAGALNLFILVCVEWPMMCLARVASTANFDTGEAASPHSLSMPWQVYDKSIRCFCLLWACVNLPDLEQLTSVPKFHLRISLKSDMWLPGLVKTCTKKSEKSMKNMLENTHEKIAILHKMHWGRENVLYQFNNFHRLRAFGYNEERVSSKNPEMDYSTFVSPPNTWQQKSML